MAVSLTRFSGWLLGGKDKEHVSNGSSTSSSLDWAFGFRDADPVKFPSGDGAVLPSSSRKVKRKWKSREERRVDKDYDVVLVPSDGVGFSDSESEDSDWSIGWLEPHAPGFQSDDEADGSFAVLVPCYKQGFKEMEEGPNFGFGNNGMGNNSNEYPDSKKYIEQWLSSLQYC